MAHPARLNEREIPDRDIGGGRTLTSIQRVDLLGDHLDDGATRLAASILRIPGAERLVNRLLPASNVPYRERAHTERENRDRERTH